MHSYMSAVNQGLLTYIHEVGAEGCRFMHQTGIFKEFSNQVILNLKIIKTEDISLALAGKIGLDGSCEGTFENHNVGRGRR